MDLRLAPTLVLLLGAAAAQIPSPSPLPTPLPAPAQDPDKPKPTPAQEAEALTAERHRLEAEIAYVRERAKNAKVILAEKLGAKKPTWKAIDAGVAVSPVQAMPMSTQPRAARVGNPDEFADHGNDVMLTVNGRPVTRGAYDQLMEHLAKTPNAGAEAQRSQRVLLELIQLEGIAAMFPDNEAAERTGDLVGQLEAGKPIAELAKAVGTLPGAAEDGRIELTRNSMYGLRFEREAFATEPGRRARPFRTANGLVILQVDSMVKGATPEQDKLVLHAIQVPYTPDAQQLQKVQASVSMGQIDVVVRDDQVLAMLPEMFRRAAFAHAQPPTPGVDVSGTQKVLEQLGQQIAALEGKDDAESKAKLQALQTRYAQLKAYLKNTTPATDAVDQQQAMPPVPEKPKGEAPPEKPKTETPPEKPKAPAAPVR
jgi:hypothetical protein